MSGAGASPQSIKDLGGQLGIGNQIPAQNVIAGGLQQMQMLHAAKSGIPANLLELMNPYTPRAPQYLPPALPAYSWASDPNNPANRVASNMAQQGNVYDLSAGGDGGDGGAGAAGGGGGSGDGGGASGGGGK